MDPREPDELIEQPSIVTPAAGLEAEQYVDKELVRTRKALRLTQILGVLYVIVTIVSVGSITVGFARSLEPDEAANIAKGLVAEHVNDQVPAFKQYIKENVPILIARVPAYVKKELPIYRVNLETQLESNLDHYSEQTSQQLQDRFDTFLTANQGGVKSLMANSQDPQALSTLDNNLKLMFADYIDNTQVNGVTLRSEIDQSLEALGEIDIKMKKLAGNKGLTDDEKKTRRAIAILLKSVDTSSNIAEARTAVDSVRSTSPAEVQSAVQGVMQFNGPDEATFTEPGKPPMVFVRKPGRPAAKGAKTAIPPSASHPPVQRAAGAFAKPPTK